MSLKSIVHGIATVGSVLGVPGAGAVSALTGSRSRTPTAGYQGISTGTSIQTPWGGFSVGSSLGYNAPNSSVAPGPGGACPKGYHLNKNALPASKRHGAVPKLSICVRNRHMNPMNGRAVARAARRIHQGEKLLRRIFQVEGKAHGKIRPKTRRK